jgi:hypothetical protein
MNSAVYFAFDVGRPSPMGEDVVLWQPCGLTAT